MENLRLEQVLLLMVFILLPLLNMLLRRIKRRVESKTPAAESLAYIPPGPRAATPSQARSRAAGDRARRLESPPDTAPLLRRHVVKRLLASKRDARRAFILMALLGPCRAFAPPDA